MVLLSNGLNKELREPVVSEYVSDLIGSIFRSKGRRLRSVSRDNQNTRDKQSTVNLLYSSLCRRTRFRESAMNWEAANLPGSRRKRKAEDGNEEDTGRESEHPASRESKSRRATETVEACLSRLSKAYNSSISCVGELKKSNDVFLKQPVFPENGIEILNRVANAGRTTLESAILMDPLISEHTPTLKIVMEGLSTNVSLPDDTGKQISRWGFVTEKRAIPPLLSSSAHKSTVRELAYLSLVNYADLLMSCCPCSSSLPSGENTERNDANILDKGVVPTLTALDSRKHCCWNEENFEDTRRLALTALCDASNLDGSDPSLWLKLACAARSIERAPIAKERGTCELLSTLKYRRLQRYALERGVSALAPHIPPNRTVMRALEELSAEVLPDMYPPIVAPLPEKVDMRLEIPRYSWSALGRLLLRACREGSGYQAGMNSSRIGDHSGMNIYGSPSIVMGLSPMLVLPLKVLGCICQFLESGSIWKFEATCRAISVSLVAARASMEEERAMINRGNIEGNNSRSEQQSQDASHLALPTSNREFDSAATTNNAVQRRPAQKPEEATTHRSSKRLLSQLITSGKIAERKFRRTSVEYCFLATTLCTTKEKHRIAIKEFLVKVASEQKSRNSRYRIASRIALNESSDRHRKEAVERLADSSLLAFVERWSGCNSGPLELLHRFLGHVAMNVEDVFSSDPGGPMVLTSCLLVCFELCSRRNGFHNALSPRFYKGVSTTGSTAQSLELFAMDLLYAELLLRQCDRYSPESVEFDDDGNLISLLVPDLLRALSEIDSDLRTVGRKESGDHELSKSWTILKIRCYWLVAGFFLWRSRISRIISESREAEEEGVLYIGKAAESFDGLGPTSVVYTPHLVSPGREKTYWKAVSPELLTKFRDEIQASSVVSLARQKFQDVMARSDRSNPLSKDLPETDVNGLAEIGETLFERYKSLYGDKEAKHSELVDDFLAAHGDHLQRIGSSDQGVASLSILKSKVPIAPIKRQELDEMSNPSILSILVTCLSMKRDNRLKIVELLARIVLTACDHQKFLIESTATAKRARRQQADGTQSEESASDDESFQGDDLSMGRHTTPKNVDEKTARHCVILVYFLIDRLSECFANQLSDAERSVFIGSNDCILVINVVLAFAEEWFQNTPRKSSHDSNLDLMIFESVRSLVRCLRSARIELSFDHIERVYLNGMIKIIITHRQILESIVSSQGNRAGRSVRQRLCIRRAEFIGSVAGELGGVLSRHLGGVQGNKIVKSSLLTSGMTTDSKGSTGIAPAEFSFFCDSMLWLYKYSSQVDSENSASAKDSTACSAFDRPIVKELRVPVVAAVIGLCGAATSTRPLQSANDRDPQDQLSLTEFFDSDVSVNDLESDGEDGMHTHNEMLRAICHATHCINLVLKSVEEKNAMSYHIETGYGPLLPLVSVRVLNNFADMLLLEFGDDEDTCDKRKRLWSEEYPFGTRTTGDILDSTLHKCYRLLYGFTIVGEKDHQVAGKDPGTSSTAVEVTTLQFIPESTTAAAQLYRCIVRAYAGGRRSPPRAALEIASAALPPIEETMKSKALRSFLFETENYFGLTEVVSIVAKSSGWVERFERIRSHIQKDKPEGSVEADDLDPTSYDNEVILVRRGISSQLARAPMPVVAGDSGKSKSESGANDERSSAARNEEEMSKKFNVILDDLCLGEMTNSEGWYRASQCLTMKADLVADRLGLSNGFTRSDKFAVPEHRCPNDSSLLISELEACHEREKRIQENGWLEFFGPNLSPFIDHCWSSFSSLKECSQDIRSQVVEDGDNDGKGRFVGALSLKVWKELDGLFSEGDFVKWQRGWGGLFVCALRQLALRFLCVALYAVHCEDGEDVLASEICESLGLLFYSQLMGSQSYGYPMQAMTDHDKHGLAAIAKECFTCAVHAVDSGGKDGGSVSRATWDLLFMVGKCYEKIAHTFRREAFSKQDARQYEKYMELAFQNYSQSLKEAKTIEDDGGLLVEQQGGSAHGSSEVLYRIHASRLKCLIYAVSRDQDDIEPAETEALRLTEKHWFKDPSPDQKLEDLTIRDRVWNVVTDIVDAMAQCRLDHQFFHRSVYRHAQALMWAPVLCDPIEGKAEGSLGTVPATRSYRLRGMNNSTNAASSAAVIMSSLFDKKRPQLCAVWVTTTAASSPFQTLNNSIRKYDSLRGKYISAYIESLRLCRRQSELETLLKWISTSRRDLPSIFQSTGLPGGGTSRKSNAQDCLLAGVASAGSMNLFPALKRLANRALASIVLQDIKELGVSPDAKKATEDHLKNAYSCFLRLNCNTDDLVKSRIWKYGSNSIPEVAALCQAYLSFGEKTARDSVSNWSGGAQKSAVLFAAVEKCRLMFPSLSGNSFSKKASSKSKSTDPSSKRGAVTVVDSSDMASFEVKVPGHLSAGSTFLSTVNLGGKTKKVKLTVPEGNPTTLRFSLKVTPEDATKDDE